MPWRASKNLVFCGKSYTAPMQLSLGISSNYSPGMLPVIVSCVTWRPTKTTHIFSATAPSFEPSGNGLPPCFAFRPLLRGGHNYNMLYCVMPFLWLYLPINYGGIYFVAPLSGWSGSTAMLSCSRRPWKTSPKRPWPSLFGIK